MIRYQKTYSRKLAVFALIGLSLGLTILGSEAAEVVIGGGGTGTTVLSLSQLSGTSSNNSSGISSLSSQSVQSSQPVQSSSYVSEERAIAGSVNFEADPNNPANVALGTNRRSIQRLVFGLNRLSSVVSAGSGPSMSEDTNVGTSGSLSGLQVYADFEWTHSQDKRALGPDGNRFSPLFGIEAVAPNEILVGAVFSYGHTNLDTPRLPISVTSNEYTVNAYAGKNFMDWLNVGISTTFTYTGAELNTFGISTNSSNRIFSVAPFVGVSHTFGAFAFSSTATYLFQYNNLSMTNNPVGINFSGPGTAHTFLQLNTLNYSVTDRLDLGALANFNVVMADSNTVNSNLIPTTETFWMTFGGNVRYAFSETLQAYVQFQADVLNSDYNNYVTTVGMSYAF